MTTLRLIAFAAFALAVTTSAEAMSPPPLPQSDGISAEARYRGVGRGRHYGRLYRPGYGVARRSGDRYYRRHRTAEMEPSKHVVAVLGPGSCGEFKYWDGTSCVDVRYMERHFK